MFKRNRTSCDLLLPLLLLVILVVVVVVVVFYYQAFQAVCARRTITLFGEWIVKLEPWVVVGYMFHIIWVICF